jgi:hypothetical protein
MTRRGIREMKHKRILFGDLQYTPQQNPYAPAGIRKMSDAWIDPAGDGYVSMLPGYTEVDDLSNTNMVTLGMDSVTGIDENGTYHNYPVVLLHDNSAGESYLRYVNISGDFSSANKLIYTWSSPALNPSRAGSQVSGKLIWYSFKENVYVYTGDDGDELGIKFNIGDFSTGTIGLDRPNVITGDDTGAAATSATGAGGGTAVKGVVKYFVSYAGQDGTEEGALSLEFGEFDAGDGDDVLLSNLPTLSTNKRRLYRTFKDGDQPFYLATLNSSDTTYTDNIADADLGDLPLKMGDPPNDEDAYVSVVWHYGRAYILGSVSQLRRIYFSDPEEPESFYTSEFGNWFYVNDGFEARVLSRIPAGLVLFKNHNTYLLQGRTPADFTLQEIVPTATSSMSVGCNAHGSAVQTSSGVYFFDKVNYAVWRIDNGGQIQKISGPIENDLRSTFTSSGAEAIAAPLFWWAKYNLLCLFRDEGNDTGKVFIFDIDRGSWSGVGNFGMSAIAPWDSSADPLSAVGMARNTTEQYGKLFRVFSGTDHGGTAISSPTVGAPTFTGDDPTVEKTFHYVDLLMKGEASKSVTVNWFVDGATTADGTATVTLTGTDSRERHRVYINERGREIDIDTGIYGIIYGYTDDTSVVQS